MFIGHWAPAFLAAAASPRAPKLGTLFIAGQLVDWAFMGFLLVGVEEMRIVPGITTMNAMDLYHMPYTHSLLGSGVFALAFAAILILWRRDLTGAIIGGLVVLSHWFIDLLVHRPDLTLAGSQPKYGLGLWNYPAVAVPLELILIIGAFTLYMRSTKGPIAPPMILIAVLLALQAFDWLSPPPDEYSMAFPFLAFFGFGLPTLIAAWVGSTRWHKREVGLAVPTMHR
ncbi:hypothetical protein [Erythrobacter litoralis]|uniref:Membrane protein, putative n=1 Tax=Erythrobacter litoralis (strain HTCC2594) TaxID=314225 RepID=Q2NAT7_ERYLH|nr:hypothetical protein [Erythrobacter litoralis]ABC63204.1 membrane protein, putative [Erythrobacter litoralis HTCC2594]